MATEQATTGDVTAEHVAGTATRDETVAGASAARAAQGTALTATPQASAHVSVALLGAAGFIVTADARIVNPLLPIIAHQFNTSVGNAGNVVTAYAIPYGLFQLVYGPLGDRIGKAPVMVFAIGLFAFGTAACALSPNLLMLEALRFITGAVAAALIPLSLAYIGDHIPYARRQVAISQYLTAIALGTILSTSIGGVVADYLSWRYIFLVYGVVSIVVFGLFLRAWRRTPEARPARRAATSAWSGLGEAVRTYRHALSGRATRLVMIAVFVEGLFFFGGFAYTGAFLRERYGLLYVVIGVILAGFGIGSLIYSSIARWTLRTLRENGQILAGGFISGGAYIAIALIPSWPLFVGLNILLGLGYYLIHSTFQTKATELAPDARGSVLSFFAFSLFLGQGIGAWLLGLTVNQWGYPITFIIAGVPMALLGVWFTLSVRGQPPTPGAAKGDAQQPLLIME